MALSPSSQKPSPTRLGALARSQLIEAAGEEFAAKGFQGTTSREICLKAGMNSAAVNYHFGGFEALYQATLNEANRRVVWTEALDRIALSDLPAKEKLKAVVRPMVRSVVRADAGSWEMRVLSREIVGANRAQFTEAVYQRQRQLLKGIIAEVIDRPADDPAVASILICVIAPIMFMAVANRVAIERILPSQGDPTAEFDLLADQMERFILAGVEAVADGSNPST
jgi:AcrR family transcriptional regulator